MNIACELCGASKEEEHKKDCIYYVSDYQEKMLDMDRKEKRYRDALVVMASFLSSPNYPGEHWTQEKVALFSLEAVDILREKAGV